MPHSFTLPKVFRFLIHSRIFWWGMLICWAGVVCVISSLPNVELPQVNIANFDKVEHTLCFSVGAMLLMGALGATFPHWSWQRRILLTVAAVSLFGWLDEWHQTFTPGRSGNDFSDWLADTIGATLGAALAHRIYLYAGRNPKRHQSPARPEAHREPAA